MVLSADQARTAVSAAATNVTLACAEVARLSATRAQLSAQIHKLENARDAGDLSAVAALVAARDEHRAIETREADHDLVRAGAERRAADARQALREAEARAAIPEAERLAAATVSAHRAFCEAFTTEKNYRRSHGLATEGQIMTSALELDAGRASLRVPRLRGVP